MGPLFLSRLAKDLIRQLKVNSASMDNDATGCYDQIKVLLGMIAARRLGLPVESVRCQSEVLKYLQYAVKTVYGILLKLITARSLSHSLAPDKEVADLQLSGCHYLL